MKKYSLIMKESSRRNSFKKKFVAAFLIVLVGLALLFIVPQAVRFVTSIFWAPYDMVRVWVLESQSSVPVYLRERHVLDKEIEQLKNDLDQLQDSKEALLKYKKENDDFQKLLNAVPESRVLARVLARPNQLPYDVLLLDRGAQHDVVKNAPVFTGDNKVIGIVTKVLEKTSHVTLVTTPGFLATAYVYGPNIYTTTEGMGSGVLRVKVPQGIVLSEQDVVILPAIDSGLFGTITRVETSPTKPERYGYVVSDTPLQGLRYVTIAKEPVVTNDFLEAQEVVADTAIDLFTVDVPTDALVIPENPNSATSTEVENLNGSVLNNSTTSDISL